MAPATIACPNCGVQIPASDHVCFFCGYELVKSSKAPAAAKAPAVAADPASQAPTMQLPPSPPPARPSPTRGLLKQRYQVLKSVGKGGMGAVYMAQDTLLGNRLVAIKEATNQGQLAGREMQDAVEAFKREAYMLAALQHPNLPGIYDYFEEAGHWYLVMSFIQGETLGEYLARIRNHRLPLEEALHIGRTLCDVLNYLHTHQPPIIFRDLKPANIMRTPDGHMYLIDFGIARHFKPGQAKDTAYYGSMGYSPPEQYGRAQTTERSDIYSLGVILYEMLSGYDPSSSPFRLPPLQSLVPNLPAQLVALITQMLDLDESKRPPNVRVVAQTLAACLASPGR